MRRESRRTSELQSEELGTNGHMYSSSVGDSTTGLEGTADSPRNGDIHTNGDSKLNRDTGEGDTHRPKRQVALNRPDYNALHHHIATPTAKWLELIADPGKFGRTIKEGE